ncbi:serine/threonine-protein kinase Sgk1 isoform X2 [Lepeophtheirus salmonis]|nr:serine/threonine-protein kinase Sgk1-like isoform X2 [Lepeophtheirus salmonis]
MAKGRFSVVRVVEDHNSSNNKHDGGAAQVKVAEDIIPSIGTISSLSGFEYKRTLGEGGYGKVYLASFGGKVYAIKVAPKRYSGKPTDEFLTLSKAGHPFIVRLHYHHIGQQKEYFVLDFCGGGDMRTLLNRVSFFNESHTAFYGSEVLFALIYLHTILKIAYRDLKPCNILVDSRGHIKLTDFGLSIPISRKNITRQKLSGTTEYMSPESFTSEGDPNHVKDDIWAFGVFLYELLFGERPFDVEVKSHTISNIMNLNYEIPEDRGLSSESRAVLRSIFVYENDRIESATQLINLPFFANYHNLTSESLSSLPAPFDPMLLSDDDVTHFEYSSFEDDKRILCQ